MVLKTYKQTNIQQYTKYSGNKNVLRLLFAKTIKYNQNFTYCTSSNC